MDNTTLKKILRVIKAYMPGQKWLVRRELDALNEAYNKKVANDEAIIKDLEDKIHNLYEHNHNVHEMNKKLQSEIEGLRNDLAVVSNNLETVSINLRNNNEIWKRHDRIVNSYEAEDKKLISDLAMEFSNLKARLSQDAMSDSVADKVSFVAESADSNSLEGAAANTSVEAIKAPAGDTYNQIDYFDFENHFRGPRDQIKEVQKIYLPYFENCKNVIDLGCGRGEFTELLHENGIGVTGVDMYLPYVEYMKMRHLPAIYGDALEYIRSQESVDGIFLGQVVEHMPIEKVIEVLNVAYEKLLPGSYLIMETPNPMCLAVFTNSFYMDPSHSKPVHPLTLQYLTQKAGFSEVNILFTESSRMPDKIPLLNGDSEDIVAFNNEMRRVENMLFGSQDYAIIARR
ncbi:O-antigen chain-terminating methyltransferase [Butyrivibrio proteoclasticus]|uniref:O-antigen chain-terminating methyltransferase n=1 Tax=Butyrivibrio proteoclasticus TaxID=43305 RepID=A0A1I5PVC4_9FIRM|nr:methyltransferase domain-containing protein [Butyrivibrio proteoclasticus]SFP37606.1 O-antigen chain-terminating methyltransferase [Butyrivibrio proteoclasticus]